MRRLLAVTLLLALLVAGVSIDAQRALFTPLNLAEPATITVEPGLPFAQFARRLADNGWMAPATRGALYLRAYARIHAIERKLQAGDYRVVPGMSAVQVLDMIVAGRSVLYELRIIEGWTFRDALDAVRSHPQLRQTLADADPAAVMRAIGRDHQHPEGRLFPDTYRFAGGTTDQAFLRRAADTMDQVLALEWDSRAEGLPYASPAEALVMASIIEKETGAAEERPRIAGVFVRRLLLGMRLQTDPTVIYGLGSTFDGNLRRRDLETDTEYNTYTRAGLPPSPICLPGRASIRAALHPAPGDELFFVSRGDGTHEFSATLDQHQAAVRRYQLKGR
ncbi:endolytic transglycosylase MltG [Fontimonas sp. SYSU GA230001]|uniref:endolytic transglycosylase MltG n=1 Tax=Fontimonas sp. SYSU GA230001 TaxID=3142450 RepID=UPI0032B3E446